MTNTSEGGVGIELADGFDSFESSGRAEISSASLGRRAVTISGVSGRNIGLQYA